MLRKLVIPSRSFTTTSTRPLPRPRIEPTTTLTNAGRYLLRSIRQSADPALDPVVVTSRIKTHLDRLLPRINPTDNQKKAQLRKVYDNAIRSLVEKACLPTAASVYERMVAEGITPSPALEAYITVVSYSTVSNVQDADPTSISQKRKDLFHSLLAFVSEDAFTITDLTGILKLMAELQISPEMLNATLSQFYKTHQQPNVDDGDTLPFEHPSFYRSLVSVAARTGIVNDALETLFDLPQHLPPNHSTQLHRAFTAYIAGIRDTRAWDRDAIDTALEVMQAQGVRLTLPIYNALISYEVKTKGLTRAFALYHALKKNKRGDAYTFGSLFNILNRTYNDGPRVRRRHKLEGDTSDAVVLRPRILYKEMIDMLVPHITWRMRKVARRETKIKAWEWIWSWTWKRGEQEVKRSLSKMQRRLLVEENQHLTTSLLNASLRIFIYSKDYAGAYVVLRAFNAHHIPANVKTYLIVYRHIMNRVRYGIKAARRMGDLKWADVFLGLPGIPSHPVMDPKLLNDLVLGDIGAQRILDCSRREKFFLDSGMYITQHDIQKRKRPRSIILFDGEDEREKGRVKYKVPTVDNMAGRNPVSVRKEYDVVPLQRLLKGAILADEVVREWEDRMKSEITGEIIMEESNYNKNVSIIIAEAKREMIPFDYDAKETRSG